MTQESFKRKFTTIFSADAAGYSRLMEGDLPCSHLKTHMYGMKYCMTVFRNPERMPRKKNEFLAVSDFLVHPFSPVD